MSGINKRIEALRAEMVKRKLDALIIPSNDSHKSEYVADHWKSRQYFSGFTGSAGTLVVTNEVAALWTDSRYFIQAEEELAGTGIELQKQSIPHAPEHVNWLADLLSPNSKVGIEGLLFSSAEVAFMEKTFQGKQISVVNVDGFINSVWSGRPSLPNSEVFEHPIQFSGKSVADKLAQVRGEMGNADHYLISALDDIAWMLNIRAADIEFTPVAISYLLVGRENCRWFVDASRINEPCLQSIQNDGVQIQEYSAFISFLKQLPTDQTVACYSGDTSWTVSQVLGSRMCSIEPLVQNLKAIKNEVEIQGFKNAMIRDGVALVRAIRWLEKAVSQRPVSEVEFSQKIDAIRSTDSLYRGESFAAIIGFKGNGAIVHYKPEAESCSDINGDGMLLVDCGAQYLDGTTDITRTICFGEPTDEQKRNHTVVLKGNLALQMHRFEEGTNGMELDNVARSVLADHGLTYGHGTGHGVGSFLRVHEQPQGFATTAVTSRGTTGFKAGMVTSNEPGFYKPGEYGIRVENLMVSNKTEDGRLEFDVLTLFPISAKLIDQELLEKSEIDWLNDYHRTVFAELSPHLTEEEKDWLAQECAPIEK